MMRTAIAVGPAVVVGSGGGATSTSTTSWDPPNRVRLPWLTAVHAAVRPAGTMLYDSVLSPRLWTVSASVSRLPGVTATSSFENQAWTVTPSTLLAGVVPAPAHHGRFGGTAAGNLLWCDG